MIIGEEIFIYQIEYTINDIYGIECQSIFREQRGHPTLQEAKEVGDVMLREEKMKSYRIYKIAIGTCIAERTK